MRPWAVIAGGLCLWGCTASFAATEASDSGVLVRQRAEAVKNSLGLQEAPRTDTLQGRLNAVENQEGELSQQLQRLNQEIARQHKLLQHVAQQKSLLMASLRDNNRNLDSQVRAAYMSGQREWLKLLLNPDDPARISRVMTYYGYLTRERLGQLQQIRDGLTTVAALEQQIETTTHTLEQLQAELGERRNQWSVIERSRAEVLADLNKTWSDKSRYWQEFSQNVQRLDRLVVSMGLALADMPLPGVKKSRSPNSARSGGGTAQWPVEGRVISQFGGGKLLGRKGIVIRADEGAPVRAAAAGRVVFSGWMNGYGHLIIVQHSDHYFSLYAFNQALYKREGDEVAAGAPIATVGHSGGRRQAALYFEVRQATQAIDPLQWLVTPAHG